MPNCAAPMLSYKDVIVVEEDELSFDTPPGHVKRWLGGFQWSFCTIDGVGWVECLQKNVEGSYAAETIFFSQGERLLFDKVVGSRDPHPKALQKGCGYFQHYHRVCSAPNSVVMRVCKFKTEGQPSPVDERGGDKVAFKAGDKKLYFNKERLCSLSSLFRAMFQGDYLENATSEVEPKNPGGPAYTPEEIKAFLEAMLPGDERIPPNPSTVISLTKLAHKYDVELLLKYCEHSLKHAHEIPIIDRMLLADRLDLKSALDHFTQMLTTADWKDLMKTEKEKVDMLSPEYLAMLFKRSITDDGA